MGVCERSFTSALIEELQAFGKQTFTVAMLHSRLVTMRWRLAFTPIYALLSEHGGNSIAIAPLPDISNVNFLPELISVNKDTCGSNAEGNETNPGAGEPASILASPTQAVETRVLLSIAIAQDADPDLAAWMTWLTTAAPLNIHKVDVTIHSLFRSHSLIALISLPITAWNMLSERPAYRFVAFIRSGNLLEETLTRQAKSLEIVRNKHEHSSRPKVKVANKNVTTMEKGRGDAFGPIYDKQVEKAPSSRQPNPLIPHTEAGRAELLDPAPALPTSPTTNETKRREPRRSNRIGASKASADPVDKAQVVTPFKSHDNGWTTSDDNILLRARQEGLNWQPICHRYFPNKTANACRKRHERLIEKLNSSSAWDQNKMNDLARSYAELRPQMWKLIADRMSENWENVESKVGTYK